MFKFETWRPNPFKLDNSGHLFFFFFKKKKLQLVELTLKQTNCIQEKYSAIAPFL